MYVDLLLIAMGYLFLNQLSLKTMNDKKTYFFKPSHAVFGKTTLDSSVVFLNRSRKVETTIILDANIMISIEKVVKEGNKRSLLKKYGLHDFIELINGCPSKSVFLSPGFAFNEMPPANAIISKQCYEVFVKQHLPGFSDTENVIHKGFSEKIKNQGYLNVDLDVQGLLAIPFSALLYLNLIDKKCKDNPVSKFEKYIDRLAVELDFLSAKEIEIAKYCFAEPSSDSLETIKIKRILRRNFLKTSEDKAIKTFDEALRVAFNGACDLNLINSANILQGKEINGVEQDVWIATTDKKLYKFSKILSYINFDGEAGKIAAAVFLPEHDKNDYWEQVHKIHKSLVGNRFKDKKEISREILIEKAKAAINQTAEFYQVVPLFG